LFQTGVVFVLGTGAEDVLRIDGSANVAVLFSCRELETAPRETPGYGTNPRLGLSFSSETAVARRAA